MKQHIEEIDVLRIIGFIFVVAQHVFGGFAWREGVSFSDSLVLSFLYVVAKPAVPIFITIAVMMMIYTHTEPVNWTQFYKKRFIYTVIPYVIWTALNIWDAKQYGEVSFGPFWGQLLAGTGRYHLWYMSMMLRIYLYFPLILGLTKIISQRSQVFKANFLLFFTLAYIFLLEHNDVTNWVGQFLFTYPTENEQRFLDRTPILWSIYIVLGIYIILRHSKFKTWIKRYQKQMLIAYIPLLLYNYYVEVCNAIPGHAVSTGYFYETSYVLFMICSIFVFYNFACYISKEKNKLYFKLKEVSNYTYTAYLAHVIVLQAVFKYFTRFSSIESPLAIGVIVFILTILITFKLTELLSLLPFSEYLLGTKKKYHSKWITKGKFNPVDMK
ncbi:acyltransferase [Desulfitobacterium sp.]|uniref:acyltransferase n=1 Tax=Desulfitobacterium sp. TaxID=49981 RepID=UPI002B20F84C|nr:acyltransferase [Desulfitobacterium sp.]MEA4900826.1 acyltransferase [Desulfitobacterium sp.]